MKSSLAGLLVMLGLSCVTLSAHSQTAEQTPASNPPSAGGSRTREFQGDDVGQVLRLLARQAKIDVAVDENVKGTIDLRLENATAREAFDVVVRQAKLAVTRDDRGVFYVARPEPVVTTLDLLGSPEVVNAIAAYKRHLYDALIKQGFNSEEAMRLVAASDAGDSIALLGKKADLPASK